MSQSFGIIENYRSFLPVKETDTIISLGEGQTPLIKLQNLPKKYMPGVEVYVKFEGSNPTCSFKDRGMTMAVTQAFNDGVKAVICASTGNTSAAAAAYASRANMRCYVLIPDGKIAMGKLAQAMMYGAVILQISGNFDEAMSLVKQVGEKIPVSIVNSINPYRLQGQKTIAFEVIDALGDSPNYHYLPVGNAGNISAHWMGYKEYFKAGKSRKNPIMVGYQANGAAPFLRGQPISNPETVATAIRIGNPQSWDLAVKAVQESSGHFDELSDNDILEAQYTLSHLEGVFCEPASATSIGGAIRDYRLGKIKKKSTVVCTLTGNGLKDSDLALESSKKYAIIQKTDSEFSSIHSVISQYL